MFFIRLDVRFIYHLWLDIWFSFYHFYLFRLDIDIDLYILVPILKLGDDISILLL